MREETGYLWLSCQNEAWNLNLQLHLLRGSSPEDKRTAEQSEMLSPAAHFLTLVLAGTEKQRLPCQPLAQRSRMELKGAGQAERSTGSLQRQQPARQKQSSWQSDGQRKSLSAGWAEWQQPHHTPQKIKVGIAAHKGKANTPITAFNSPINSQKHCRQGFYSIFTPCVPSNGSCIMFHTEGNYLLNFFCTGGVNALIFCRCLSWTHSLQMLWPTMRCAFLFYRAAVK